MPDLCSSPPPLGLFSLVRVKRQLLSCPYNKIGYCRVLFFFFFAELRAVHRSLKCNPLQSDGRPLPGTHPLQMVCSKVNATAKRKQGVWGWVGVLGRVSLSASHLLRYALAGLAVHGRQGLLLAQVQAVPPALRALSLLGPALLLLLVQLLRLALLHPAAVVEHLPPRAKVNVLPPQDVDQVNVLRNGQTLHASMNQPQPHPNLSLWSI